MTLVTKPGKFQKQIIFSHLICTLISENEGLEKSMSASNLRNISGPGNLDFFRSPSRKKARFIVSEKIQVTN